MPLLYQVHGEEYPELLLHPVHPEIYKDIKHIFYIAHEHKFGAINVSFTKRQYLLTDGKSHLYSKPIQDWTPNEDNSCSQREGFEHVISMTYATIHVHLTAPSNGLYNTR